MNRNVSRRCCGGLTSAMIRTSIRSATSCAGSSIARPHTPHTSRPECGKSPVTQHHYSRLATPSSASHRCQLDLHTAAAYACQPTRPHCAAVQPQESAREMKPQLGSLKPRGAAAASARCVSEPTADVPYCSLAHLLSGNWLPYVALSGQKAPHMEARKAHVEMTAPNSSESQ